MYGNYRHKRSVNQFFASCWGGGGGLFVNQAGLLLTSLRDVNIVDFGLTYLCVCSRMVSAISFRDQIKLETPSDWSP